MDFLSKQFNRVGKQSENYQITFKPIVLKVNVYASSQYYIIFKRGPQKDESKKYKLEPQSNGLQMQQLLFEDEVFQRVSSFYQEKDGKFQKKSADVIIKCINQVKEEKISEVSLNLSSYIGRGSVKDSIQLTGSAYFLDFEIEVVKSEGASGDRQSQVESDQQRSASQAQDSDDEDQSPLKSQISNDSKHDESPNMRQSKSVVVQNINTHEREELQELQEKLTKQQKENYNLKLQAEQLQNKIQEIELSNQKIEEEKDVIHKELEKRGEVQKRWQSRCTELETEIGSLKKEAQDYYSADRFDNQYD
ncbi:UNKNOWN [Stylonychia lemnae]|uniref:C2 NT-type domain-containing protein n=1 Tax=Stylonychia lemnae TaxID=5949 RepID=A0A078B8B4_STYLE|nr:UNKNOWN [Stylonychia lemnae]|eukprot:CDW89532.1 UNKNOWN [Stylonychia lemnae]